MLVQLILDTVVQLVVSLVAHSLKLVSSSALRNDLRVAVSLLFVYVLLLPFEPPSSPFQIFIEHLPGLFKRVYHLLVVEKEIQSSAV